MWAAVRARLERLLSRDPARPDETASAPPAASAPSPRDPPDSAAEGAFAKGRWGRRIGEGRLEEILDDLEITLLENDVALPVAEKLRAAVGKELAGRRLRWGADVEAAVRGTLERTLRSLFPPPFDLAERIRRSGARPFVILVVGVNGSGKTTTIAKLALWLRDRGLTSAVAASDTFRAGAIEQLLAHGERLGVRVIRQQAGSDPAAVAFDAVTHARARAIDVVLVDTAGRQHTNENLLEEARKIRRVVAPQLTLYVGDSLSGNDMVEQAREFQAALGLDALVLTKLDADAKGGSSVSAAAVTGRPILFFGTGQDYHDLRPFDADWLVGRLFEERAAA